MRVDQVIGIKLLDSMMEEPVGNHWVLLQGLAAAEAGVRVIGADEACKLWPLEVGRTVCEEDGGQTNCVYHANEAATLLEPVLPGSTQRGSIVQHMIRENFPESRASRGCWRT